MVMLPEGYCIDSTEVTRAQYQAWLDTNPALPGSSDVNCGWKTSFVPDANCMTKPFVCRSGCGNHPQVCVDWCDAYYYCYGVGKRLCGKIGGGAISVSDLTNASLSQWLNACVSDEANNTFPYGNTNQPNYCNGADHDVGTTVPVGSMTSCQSAVPGYQGVFDLSGNVIEEEDSCDGASQWADCYYLGGSFYNVGNGLSCYSSAAIFRSFVGTHLGFRCCS
jgi:formylglycine-generating enzyme